MVRLEGCGVHVMCFSGCAICSPGSRCPDLLCSVWWARGLKCPYILYILLCCKRLIQFVVSGSSSLWPLSCQEAKALQRVQRRSHELSLNSLAAVSLWFCLVKSIPRTGKGMLGCKTCFSLAALPLGTAVLSCAVCLGGPRAAGQALLGGHIWHHHGFWAGNVSSMVSSTIKDCLMWAGVSDLRCERNWNTVCYVTLSC